MSLFISASSLATTVATSSSQQPRTPFGCSGHKFGYVVVHQTRRTAPNLSLTLNLSTNRTAHVCTAGPGEEDTKMVLDAFFLGKAVGEALTERIEASVGEFLSIIGKLQAEQQKLVQEFQEDVLAKAKRAKEQAALEAMKSGVVPSPAAFDANAASSSPTFDAFTVSNVTTTDATTYTSSTDSFADESDPEFSEKGPHIGVSNDD